MKDFRELKVWEKAHHLLLPLIKLPQRSLKRSYMGLQVRSEDVARQFRRILRKDVVARGIQSCTAFCRLLPDRAVSWNTKSYLLVICIT